MLKLGIKRIKIPSGEITNVPYLKKIGSLKKRIILSTCMSNLNKIQREINDYQKESLQAIIPGIVLTKLWQIVSITENIMLSISSMVIASAILGMIAILFSNLNSRRK